MPVEAGSLQDVQAWARSEFSDYLASVTECDLETIDVEGEYADGKIVLQPILITVLHVGKTRKEQTVYARITGSSDVELVSEEEIKSPADSTKLLRYLKPVVGLNDVIFTEPFRWITETKVPAAVDRLEALVRYMFLKGGENLAVQPKLLFFKTHFRAACHDVHNGMQGIFEDEDMNDTETLPDGSSPDIDDNQAVTTIFNDHAHALDESYQNFKISVLHELVTMRDMDRENMALLQAQNQNLERRLVALEQIRVEQGKKLEDDRAKLKTALGDAEKWKMQFEGLKSTLQGALGQSF